ncbi:MAG: Nucleotide sugar dehydrogenase [Candidatus Levybacteria bacterium GW2011_GWC1_40_19]|nr:MAG: Nucleotide sugar dehydrogenase [Candidatus Levybacteria bacterium GW2011_GWC1_40_19]
MTITFIGHGYVGLVTAAVFADLGNTVNVVGHTPEKIENLKKGIIPIFEPGLSELVKKNIDAGRLMFTLSFDKVIPEADVVFIAVGTPSTTTGDADLSTVLDVAEKIGKNLKGYTVVATKSTVPAGTNKKVQRILAESKPKGAEVSYASVPEFLREGSAISDTVNPDRIVIGASWELMR